MLIIIYYVYILVISYAATWLVLLNLIKYFHDAGNFLDLCLMIWAGFYLQTL